MSKNNKQVGEKPIGISILIEQWHKNYFKGKHEKTFPHLICRNSSYKSALSKG